MHYIDIVLKIKKQIGIRKMRNVYRRYNYSIFGAITQGAEKVGKTNIITRFTKDEFTEAHNLTLEGKQTAELDKDGKIFEINLYDTAGQENMSSMKAVWRNGKHGFLFAFALNNEESFTEVLAEIKEIRSDSLFKGVAIILIGNKSDLEYQRKITKKVAQGEANKLGVKYFEISAKTSSKEEIDSLISQLVDMNEMQKFYSERERGHPTNRSFIFSFLGSRCEGSCTIF